MRILVVGSVALDTIETPFGRVEDALGGAAVYFSVAASYFTEVAMVAVVGQDFPREHIGFLNSLDIDTSGLDIEEGETFRWSGSYGYDLNNRETLDTQLNVFEDFRPRIPEEIRRSELVFLANIDPELQKSVLEQVDRPRFVACDTMNFWIERKREQLLETISMVDAIVMNDAECRQLAEEPGLVKAARKVLTMGPKMVIVKKGEHGAMMFSGADVFSAPAFPLESVFDPTGAGDSFAGGLLGFLAYTADWSPANIRRAIIYGTVMASYCVEEFSVRGLFPLEPGDIEKRFLELKELSHFEPYILGEIV